MDGSPEPGEARQAAEFATRLRDAHARLRAHPMDAERTAALAARLIAVGNAAKHDLGAAARRLDQVLADIDDGQRPRGDGDPQAAP